MNKLYTIVNKSDVYILDKVKEVYTSWGYTPNQMLVYTQWKSGLASQNNMFSSNFVKLDLTRDSDRTAFKELVDNNKRTNLFNENWFGNGVIIVCNSAPGKWLRTFTEQFGGVYDSEISVEDILDEIDLSKENKEFIKYYVGENVEDLLIIRNSLKNIENTKNLTIEELYSYLPNKMGEVPPWNLIKYVLEGNIKKMEEEFQRVIVNTHPLVIIKLIKNKVNDLIVYRNLNSNKIREQEILDILGYTNSYRLNEIKRCKCKNLDKLLKTFYEYEYKLKDGSSFLPDIKDLTHDMLIKVTILIRG